MDFDPNRRKFLQGTLAAGAAAVAEVIASSPALAILAEFFNNAPAMPNAEKDPTAFRAWFFDRERRFNLVANHPEVRKVLDAPIDEHLDFKVLDDIMKQLVANWPIAWNDDIRHIPEVDTALARWVTGGLEKEFPSIDLAFRVTNEELIRKMNIPAGRILFRRGNGSLIEIDGHPLILTARHALADTEFAEPPWTTADKSHDMVLIDAKAYFKSRNMAFPQHLKPMPYRTPTAHEQHGRRVVFASHDAGGGIVLRNRNNMKLIATAGLKQSDAVLLWTASYRNPDKANFASWREALLKARNAPIKFRQETMKQAKKYVENTRLEERTTRHDVLVMLPPGESRAVNGQVPAEGISGSGARDEGVVVGAIVLSKTLYVDELDEHRRNLCFSLGIYQTGIDEVVAAYRAWKAESQKWSPQVKTGRR